jgi:putative ABC transport system permease protein
MAIIPGVALSQLWSIISSVDTAFFIMTLLVSVITLIGLLLALFISLQQRKRELAILRTMGAHPSHLFTILILESLFITVTGVSLGVVFTMMVGLTLNPILEEKMGLILSLHTLSMIEVYIAVGSIAVGLIASCIPALLAYKNGLTEGFKSI